MPAHFDSDLRRLLVSNSVSSSVLRLNAPVVTLQQSTTVDQALRTLSAHKLISAPVVAPGEDQNGAGATTSGPNSPGQEVVCFIDLKDILLSFLQAVDLDALRGAKLLRRMAALEESGAEFAERPLGSLPVLGGDGSFHHESAAQRMSLLELVHTAFLEPANRGIHGGSRTRRIVHRVALYNKALEITHIVSQSDVIRFLHAHKASLGPAAQRTVRELGWARHSVVTVKPDVPAVEALQLMAQRDISGLAVVDSEGSLVGNFSVSDLRAIGSEHFGALALPVAEFLAREHGTEFWGMTTSREAPDSLFMQQSGEGGEGQRQSAPSPVEPSPREPSPRETSPREPSPRELSPRGVREGGVKVASGQELDLVNADDTFAQVLDKLVQNKRHRVYVVEDRLKPVGIVTLTDVLQKVVADAH